MYDRKLPTMNECERTSVLFFTRTQRRAGEPGIVDHSRCQSAWSMGGETRGTGTVVAVLSCGVVSAVHAAVMAIPTATNRPPARLRNEGRVCIVNTSEAVFSRSPDAANVRPLRTQ
jgi:hypothetical protein